MSRVAKKPINLAKGVEIKEADGVVTGSGLHADDAAPRHSRSGIFAAACSAAPVAVPQSGELPGRRRPTAYLS